MNSKLHYLRTLRGHCPIGLAALVVSVICSSLYTAILIDPTLQRGFKPFRLSEVNSLLLTVILGSGTALLLVLFSLALERWHWPALIAGVLLLATETIVFPMMPIWTAMVLAGKSGWFAALYVLAMLIALYLLGRRYLLPYAVKN